MNAPILIAGGYGVAGSQIARLLRQRHPDLPLLIAGRNPTKGTVLAAELGHARAVKLDTTSTDPLTDVDGSIGAIVGAVNDLDDRLLTAAIDQGIPLVDITRWTALVHRALTRTATGSPTAPIMMASGWMGGAGPLLAAWAARDVGAVETVDISIRYAQSDASGPDSVEYIDRLAERYEATIDGRQQLVNALSDRRHVAFADGSAGSTYRFDTPEQLTLPVTLGAHTATTRIGFDSALATKTLVAFRRIGLMRLLARPRFETLRRKILHNPGTGGVALFRVDVTGDTGSTTVQVRDEAGQSHLTAAGAVVALERIIGLDGGPPEPHGMRFPEQHPDPETAVTALRSLGIEIERTQSRAHR